MIANAVERVFVKKPRKKAPIVSVERLMTLHYKEHERVDKQQRQRGCFHPSQLSHCRKQQQLDIIFARKHATTVPVLLMRIFDQGHATEVRLARALARGAEMQGGSFTPKVRVAIPELLVYGELDGILKLPNPDGGWYYYIVDFKTINHRRMTELLKLSKNYRWQFTAYEVATGIPQTICFYEDKDNQQPKEFFHRHQTKTWEYIQKHVIRPVLRATAKGVLVPPDEDNCDGRHCPYYQPCTEGTEFADLDRRTDKQRKLLPVVR